MEVTSLRGPQLTERIANAAETGVARGQELERSGADDAELRKQFDTFVGESFYGQMLGAMRKTVGKPAYFHGGQAEEVFRGQLDQMLAGKLAEASAHNFTGPMFDLFMLHRA